MENKPPVPLSQQPPPLCLLPPPPIVVRGIEHDPLNDYLKSWAVKQGYKILAAHSSQDGKTCQYGCHQGGKPCTKENTNTTTTKDNETSLFLPLLPTQSINIGREFNLIA